MMMMQLNQIFHFLFASLCISNVHSFTIHSNHYGKTTISTSRPPLAASSLTHQAILHDDHGHGSSTDGLFCHFGRWSSLSSLSSLRSNRRRRRSGGSHLLSLTAKSDSVNDDDDEDNDDEYDDDDEYVDGNGEEDPLANGVDSISWLPPLSSMTSLSSSSSSLDVTGTSTGTGTSIAKQTEILPFFPLGGIVYTPNSEHVLNIFEPRYRQMYTDILMNGSKRFVVAMSHPEKPGIFAETGVIFYLDDLKEVSEETGDQIKYICNHKVTKRVKIHKIVNPEAWASRKTYLKVEGTILDEEDGGMCDDRNVGDGLEVNEDDEDEDDDDEDDDDEDDQDTVSKDSNDQTKASDVYRQLMESLSPSSSASSSSSSSSSSASFSRMKAPHEKALIKSFQELVQKQHELEEDVRFTRASVATLAVEPGDGQDSLWMTIRLWQSFIEQRLVARQNEMQMDFQEKLLEFLRNEKGLKENELPSAIGFSDLSPALQNEVQELQKRMAVELRPLVLESTLAIQKILEAENHEERCKLLKYFMDAEKQRLDAKKQLRGMFEGAAMDEDVVPSSRTFGGDVGKGGQVENETNNEHEDGDGEEDDDGPSSRGSLLFDEPDAFQ